MTSKKQREHLLKLNKSKIGTKHKLEAIEKMRKAKIGKKLSKKTKMKLSKALSKRTLTKAHKKKISKALKGRDAKWLKGKSNPNWKGGKYPKDLVLRRSKEYKAWRGLVFKRDKYACQKCNKVGGDLNAHHIENFEDYPEARLAISNGITFCNHCHERFHKTYGFRSNNNKQLKEYLCQK